MFAIYNNVTRGSLINFCFVFFSSYYYLFKPSIYSITIIIITIMFIDITVMGVLEKSSGGDFQARNSSGMVYPYSSC